MKILLGDLNKNLGTENISIPTIGYGKLHEDNNDKDFITVNCATSKWFLRSSCSAPKHS
jgi:hypothetical protein